MKKPATTKNDLVRDEILRAAKDLFQTYGLKKTTMEDIAEACRRRSGIPQFSPV